MIFFLLYVQSFVNYVSLMMVKSTLPCWVTHCVVLHFAFYSVYLLPCPRDIFKLWCYFFSLSPIIKQIIYLCHCKMNEINIDLVSPLNCAFINVTPLIRLTRSLQAYKDNTKGLFCDWPEVKFQKNFSFLSSECAVC